MIKLYLERKNRETERGKQCRAGPSEEGGRGRIKLHFLSLYNLTHSGSRKTLSFSNQGSLSPDGL